MILHNKTEKATILHQTSVVGSISLPKSLNDLRRICDSGEIDVVELRLDLYPDAAESLVSETKKLNLPLLATARCPAEGGKNDLTARQREDLSRPLLGTATFVDLEISSLGEMSGFVQEIVASPALLLASFHDFSGTPTLSELTDSIRQAVEAGADAVKFATTLRGPEDIATLVSLFAIPDRPPLSVMGMGPLGKISRLLFGKLGSILNYGYLDAATVPGQWEARRLKELLAEINRP